MKAWHWLSWVMRAERHAVAAKQRQSPMRIREVILDVMLPGPQMHAARVELAPYTVVGEFHETAETGRVRCTVCPRHCVLSDGQRAFCFVRQAQGGDVVLTSYGRSTGFCIDPIEKKPLNHFYPGTAVLSFGTAGCNLGCKFCQNWDISKAKEIARLSSTAYPDAIARAAAEAGCRSVAFTYNDPVVFLEYAVDTAIACHDRGVRSVAVTAGYVTPKARTRLFAHMDAANVDLKAFTERFYHKLCFAHLEPVLETLRYLVRETDVWTEITTLVIPDENDSLDELGRLSDWIAAELGLDVPLHLTAFHPDFKLTDKPRTPRETLVAARRRALAAGLHHVYTGNVHDAEGGSTYCPQCHEVVIERDWYTLGAWRLRDGLCARCGAAVSGCFDARPGTWGARRLPLVVTGR